MNAPPSNGPRIAAIVYATPTKLISVGLFFGSAEKANMMVPPVEIPAPPTPAIARPTINAFELGAVAQIRLPISKSSIVTMKVDFREKYLKALPHDD